MVFLMNHRHGFYRPQRAESANPWIVNMKFSGALPLKIGS